jgi:pyruvyltransferase
VGTRKYRLGIVPHYVDKGSPEVERLRASPDVRIIDIEGGILEVIDQINSCENVVSSSLHGMIVADAYGIPSAWVTMSGRVAGEGFKFRDYLASVGRDGMEAYPVVKGTSAADLEHQCNGDPIRIDLIRLWDVCPFRRADSGATAESASDEAVSRSAGASRTGQ